MLIVSHLVSIFLEVINYLKTEYQLLYEGVYSAQSCFPDVVALGRAYFGSSSGAIYLDSVVCNGSEGTLLQCTASPIGVHNCDHSEDAGVRCGGIIITVIIAFLLLIYTKR